MEILRLADGQGNRGLSILGIGSRPAEPYDLASGIELIRCAGGDVVDLANRPVELTGHTGPFIVGIDSCQKEQTLNMVAEMADAFA